MFKLAKYYLLFNLYKRGKKNIMVIIVLIIAMIFVSYIFNDLMKVVGNGSQFELIAIKWLIFLSLFFSIIINLFKVMKRVTVSLEEKDIDYVPDNSKEKLLAKRHLKSRSDLILEKYRNNK